MAVVRRIGPGSAFKVGLVLYGLLGLLLGIFVGLISMVTGSLASFAESAAPGAKLFGFGMGLGAIFFFPICYGIIGGVFGAISAAIYNLVASWVGGLEVDLT